MLEAPVGFQCPDCYAQGARQMRSRRGLFAPQRHRNPRLVTIILMALNALVWIATVVAPVPAAWLVFWIGLNPVGHCVLPDGRYYPVPQSQCRDTAASWIPGVADGAWWQPLTSAFTHLDWWHLVVNLVTIWFIGPPLEQALGRSRYLVLFLGSALAGSLAAVWLSDPHGVTVGASGAGFGLLGALLVIAYRVRGNYRLAAGLLAINLVITVLGASFISWQGHLGGLLAGLAIGALAAYAPRGHRTHVQLIGFASLGIALLAGFVGFALTH